MVQLHKLNSEKSSLKDKLFILNKTKQNLCEIH